MTQAWKLLIQSTEHSRELSWQTDVRVEKFEWKCSLPTGAYSALEEFGDFLPRSLKKRIVSPIRGCRDKPDDPGPESIATLFVWWITEHFKRSKPIDAKYEQESYFLKWSNFLDHQKNSIKISRSYGKHSAELSGYLVKGYVYSWPCFSSVCHKSLSGEVMSILGHKRSLWIAHSIIHRLGIFISYQ